MADRVVITIAEAGAAGASRGIRGVTGSLHGLAGAAAAAAGIGGIGGLAAATVKWGLSFNAQVESARLRFGLFTRDVKGLTAAVSQIDKGSAFNFADLSDAAALLGTSGVQNIPKVLQATANAAAASGKGLPALQSISIALAQIQAKGKLSQEEINQLNEAGAPGAQRIIQHAFHLTSKQLGNLGNQGLDATKAVVALTDAWTSGRMARAAQAQTKTLGGQWNLLTGNLQKLSGTVLLGLTGRLEHGVLPALNATASGIQDIFGQKGFSDEQKWRYTRDVIRRQLGPVAADIWADIKRQDIPRKLGHEFEIGADYAANGLVNAVPNMVSRFVDAWLGAGPWAKLISGAWLASRLGLSSGVAKALAALIGGGGGAGAAGLLAGRGSLRNPMYVVVLNGKGGLADEAKKVGGLAGLATGLGASGALSFASLLAVIEGRNAIARKQGVNSTVTGANVGGVPFVAADPIKQGRANFAIGAWIAKQLGFGFPGAGGQAGLYQQGVPLVSPVNPAAMRTATAPSLAGAAIVQGGFASPFQITVPVSIDGREVARVVAHQANKKKALK